MSSNNAVILKKGHQFGPIKKGETLEFIKRPYDFKDPSHGEFIVQTLYLSIDPYLRGRIREKSIPSYMPPFEEGKPITSSGIGRIYKSKNPNFKEGQIISGMLDWAEYTHIGDPASRGVEAVENKYNVPLSLFIGVLGMPGFTAYGGLKHIGKPKQGETIFISAASGAVGQVVGQLAKLQDKFSFFCLMLIVGLRVIGSAGNDKKVKYLLEELGFDGAFNYKTEKPKDALPRLCPDGIDVYWENVGGETLDAVLVNANNFARFVACGMISSYGKPDPYGVKNLMYIVGKRIRFEGFIQNDLRPQYYEDFKRDVGKNVGEGKITSKEDVTDGLENAIDGFIGMLEGKNFGKAVIKVAE